jgi:UDP-N-acetylmuramoyl-tripeptide--D-alanyl-D-alanine ligase
MTLWTSEQAVAATGGQSAVGWVAQGVSIDTRSLVPGDLFVALSDQRDGHAFVAEALAKGAAAALVSRVPDGVADDAPLLIVEDVLEGLRGLARAARARTQAKVIGITGSVGKTSTKEMLRVMLGAQARVHAAEKSFNNHWGVPLTLARMPADAEYAVIEIGMNHPGEIAPLARLADLDAALVTVVAAAHLEAFDGIEGIAREKAAIMDGLRPTGIAVLNADIETSGILFAQAGARAIGFGVTAQQACLLDVQVTQDATSVRARIAGQDVLFKLQTPGRHFAMNALGALALVAALGGDLGRAVLSLVQWRPVDGRGVRETILLDDAEEGCSFELIDDAYNANPASVGAALEMLAAVPPRDGVGRVSKGRRIAILGDMLELGPAQTALHRDLSTHPAMQSVDLVHCVGPCMRHLFDALPHGRQGLWVAGSDDLLEQVPGLVDAGDVVLAKGSLGSRLSPVVDALRKLGQAAPDKT